MQTPLNFLSGAVNIKIEFRKILKGENLTQIDLGSLKFSFMWENILDQKKTLNVSSTVF
jgi:hypothetical protein